MFNIYLKGERICGGCTGLEDGVVPLFDMVEVSAPSHLFTRCYECCSCFIGSLFTTSYYGGSTSGVGSDVVVGKNVSLYNSEICPHSCPGVLDYCSLILSGEGVVWEGSSGLLVGMEGYFSAVSGGMMNFMDRFSTHFGEHSMGVLSLFSKLELSLLTGFASIWIAPINRD